MTLDQLLAQLPDPIAVVSGPPPAHVELRVVLEVPGPVAVGGGAAPREGGLYLVPDGPSLETAVAWAGGRPGIALLAPTAAFRPGAGARSGATTLLALDAPRVPLDLAARIQRALLEPPAEGLTAGSVAVARQGLVEDVVHGRFQDPLAVLARARAVGVELESARVVLVAAIDDFERFYLRHESEGEPFIQRVKGKMAWLVRQEAVRLDPRAAVVPVGDAVVALLSAPTLARAIASEVAARLRRELRFVPAALGTGTVKESWTSLAASFREAEMALQLRRRLRWRVRHVAFDELTGFALLQLLEGAGEVRALLEAELAPLVEADRLHHTHLVETLAAWFDAGSSLKRAAEALNVHPKTLRYRLDRIGDLLGPGALDGDKRLLFYLASRSRLWAQG